MVDTVVMGPPKLTPSFQSAALYFAVNWASDQNNYMLPLEGVVSTTIVVAKERFLVTLT